MTIGSETSEEMDQEVERTALARVLDLADVLELIVDTLDTLDNRPFAQQLSV